MPEVSVVIPTYNRAGFLRSAIRSILNQTFQDFEIIVVDDGSTDCSAKEVVSEFRDPRIRYIRHEVNRGGSAARNTGIKSSKGKYIAFLDDDDEWLPEKLERQINVIDSSSERVGGVYTGFLLVNRESGKVISRRIPYKSGNLYKELVSGNCIGTTSTLLLKRECFDKVGLFDEILLSSQDYDMWIRISKEFFFECLSEPLVRYYVHRRRITTTQRAVIEGMELMLRKYEKGYFVLNKKALSNKYLSLGVIYCLSGDVKRGRYAFLKAIKLYPFGVRHYFNLVLSLLGAGNFKKVKEAKNQLALSLKS